MRRRKGEIRARVNRDLDLAFCESGLSSFGGLELLGRYLRRLNLNDRIRGFSDIPKGGDFGTVALIRLVVGLLIVGGRRCSHIDFLRGDPMVERFCGLKDLPGDRTLRRWLKSFRARSVEGLRQLNAELVGRTVALYLGARTLTIDVDGTVLSTGQEVAWAARGYNPHRRKVPSYFPITAHLAETGHLLRVRNRPGNINDGKASLTFLRGLFKQIGETLGTDRNLRFRMDGDYFKQGVLELLDQKKAGYAIKVPFWQYLNLQSKITGCSRWTKVSEDLDGFFTEVKIKSWDKMFRVAIYRQRVHHETSKNYQLDLFDPNDGTWEYSAVATNLRLNERRLWKFMSGRGLHEKVIGDLKSGLAFDSIPTNHYGANNAWQQLVVLAHNILTSFQIETGAVKRPKTHKYTTHWILKQARTMRLQVFNRAARITRPHGKTRIGLQKNHAAEKSYRKIESKLPEVT